MTRTLTGNYSYGAVAHRPWMYLSFYSFSLTLEKYFMCNIGVLAILIRVQIMLMFFRIIKKICSEKLRSTRNNIGRINLRLNSWFTRRRFLLCSVILCNWAPALYYLCYWGTKNLRCFLCDFFGRWGGLVWIVKIMRTIPSIFPELPSGNEKPGSLGKFSTSFYGIFPLEGPQFAVLCQYKTVLGNVTRHS